MENSFFSAVDCGLLHAPGIGFIGDEAPFRRILEIAPPGSLIQTPQTGVVAMCEEIDPKEAEIITETDATSIGEQAAIKWDDPTTSEKDCPQPASIPAPGTAGLLLIGLAALIRSRA